MINSPSSSATHGQRFDGSPGSTGADAGGTVAISCRPRNAHVSCPTSARHEDLWYGSRVRSQAPTHDVRIGEDGGRAALLVDGVVQSISPEDSLHDGGYWAAMVPSDERPHHALILG